MIKIILKYALLIFGITLISYESLFNSVYYKIFGLGITMFSIYNLQKGIPNKGEVNEDNNLNDE